MKALPSSGREQAAQGARLAQVLREQLVERAPRRLDLRADDGRELAVVAQQALHALAEGAACRIEVAAQGAAERFVEQLAMLGKALLERAEQAVGLAADRRTIDRAARGLEREDADLECREGQLLPVAALGGLGEGGDRFRIGDREVEVDRVEMGGSGGGLEVVHGRSSDG